jgi:hypothetical protein
VSVVGSFSAGVTSAQHGQAGSQINSAFYNIGFNAAWNVAKGAAAGGSAGGIGLTSALLPLSGGKGHASASSIMSFFQSKGLSKAQAAGIVGNFMQESSLTPGDNSASGLGLAQWIGGRRTAEVAYAKGLGLNPLSENAELQFAWHELNTSEKGALTALRGASSPAEAAKIFEKLYERAGIPALSNREAYANAAFAASGAPSIRKATSQTILASARQPVQINNTFKIDHMHTEDMASYKRFKDRLASDLQTIGKNVAFDMASS